MEPNARPSFFIGWPLEVPATKLIYWHSGTLMNYSDEIVISVKEKVTMIIKYISTVNVGSGDVEIAENKE